MLVSAEAEGYQLTLLLLYALPEQQNPERIGHVTNVEFLDLNLATASYCAMTIMSHCCLQSGIIPYSAKYINHC